VIIAYGLTDQHDYAAIVLMNPPVASKPLELSATVVRDKPRKVTILDPEWYPWRLTPRRQAVGLPVWSRIMPHQAAKNARDSPSLGSPYEPQSA
jgi:hypothetical protein